MDEVRRMCKAWCFSSQMDARTDMGSFAGEVLAPFFAMYDANGHLPRGWVRGSILEWRRFWIHANGLQLALAWAAIEHAKLLSFTIASWS